MTVAAPLSLRYRAPFGPGGAFEVDASQVERLLSLALVRGGDYADAFFEYRVIGSLTMRDGVVRVAHRGVTCGAGLRVRVGDRVGVTHVESLAPEDLARAAATASRVASAEGGAWSPVLVAHAVGRSHGVDRSSLDVDANAKLDILRRAEAAARAYDAQVTHVECGLAEELREIMIATSDGGLRRDTQPLVRFRIRVTAQRGRRRSNGYTGGGGRHSLSVLASGKVEELAREAARRAVAMIDARAAPAGSMAVVLSPGNSGILIHEAIGHGLEADFVRRGTSAYSGEIDRPVASPLCTIVDDGRLAGARGTIDVDDEGTDTGRTTLLEGGVLRRYMVDRQTARHFKVAPTGNARRQSFRAPPLPRMTNTLLEAGPHDPEEIVRSVERGLFARGLGPGQVDITTGNFVFTVTEGYLIEGGRLTAPVAGVTLVGCGPTVLRQVTMVGTDFRLSDGIFDCQKRGQSVPVGVGCPTFLVRDMTVGGTDQGFARSGTEGEIEVVG